MHDDSPYFPETPRLNLLRQIDSLAREFCDVLATIIADGQTTSKRAGHHFGALTAVVAFLSQVGRRKYALLPAMGAWRKALPVRRSAFVRGMLLRQAL
ncbi:hypothetical protein [Candidatus Accumulibacter sp. ACC012]|uniref:hypothetical protein n=1 Tax=Candidatus Accumulibacter sp. ACC012 TaxID=2823332 RepID=UPI0025BDF818|nr:hypothetical protein [Candidatus Accumulibacter sp. ACC012]